MAEIRSLVEADSAVTKSLLAALVQLLLGVWSRVDPYSPEQVEVAAMKSADLVLRATRQARLATRAYNKRSSGWARSPPCRTVTTWTTTPGST